MSERMMTDGMMGDRTMGEKMTRDRTNQEALADEPTRRQAIIRVAMAFGGLAIGSTKAKAGTEDEVSHTAESIHQEPFFKATRKRVY